ncbi:MAG: DMT family transporter [Acidobacteriota bacterium]|nr:DMT family transporter [Acidobacteriota bacterium]OQB57250.1 MAG: putative inner membrane transporter yiJE [Candidatus Aminicenantes bacterium ADurb.Bin147]HNQ81326.1 DMT family transporter [Candidatus Aminicenantes bacterium]HOY99496.1 DMT family transporter [Candidatus Aminicenantes bacterium]HPH43906.1 DMT family transporter [Candidatus Aminicenantes bacterium]
MSRSRSLLAVHASVALFGLAGLFGKWLTLQPHFIVLGRVVFAAAALALIIRLSGGRFSIRRKIDGGLFLLQGLILAVHWILFFESIRVSTVAVGLLAYSSFPVFTAFLEPLFFRTRLSRRHLGLSLACLAGVFLLVPRFSWSERVFQGVVTGLGAGATFALLSIINRKLSFRYASPVVAFYQDAGAALFLLPAALLKPPALTGRDFALLAILGLLCTALAHTLFIAGMRRLSAQTASIISALEPVYGIALAALLLGERPSARTIAGGLIILTAVFVLSLSNLKRKKPAAAGRATPA